MYVLKGFNGKPTLRFNGKPTLPTLRLTLDVKVKNYFWPRTGYLEVKIKTQGTNDLFQD